MELTAAVVQSVTKQFVHSVEKEAHYALGLSDHCGHMKQTLEVAKELYFSTIGKVISSLKSEMPK